MKQKEFTRMNNLLEVKKLSAVNLADMVLKVDEGKASHEDRRRLESFIRVYRSCCEDLWRAEGREL